MLLLLLAAPLFAESGSISTCLQPCHAGMGLAPDIAADYNAGTRTAGHTMNWSSKVVADSTGAIWTQGSRMPCSECHVAHGQATSSIHSFSEARVGGPITSVRQLCEGCHRPCDSSEPTPTACGLELRKLPAGPDDHADDSDRDCFDCHGGSGHGPEGHGDGGLGCGDISCHGGSGSHAIHLTAGDPRGPGALGCYDCHESGDAPHFATGVDEDLSGDIELDESADCDACHSPGGSYDGVDSTATASGVVSIGAKNRWLEGVYETTSTLKAGMGRWCVGCHDGYENGSVGQLPSLIDDVYAPPVAGDETTSFTYGMGWGYYMTGHGTPSSTVPSANGSDSGPELECDACHDYTAVHIDGERRSYTSTGTADDYRRSYRLDLVDGENPMLVPWPASSVYNSADNYRLCTRSGCHDPYPFLNENASDRRTNFWKDAGYYSSVRDTWYYNMHKFHLSFLNQLRWSPDWSGPNTSAINCVTCHNVHGSTRMAMIHDGSLISDTVTRTPGMRIWYLDDEVSTWNEGNAAPPIPADVTMATSEGWIWSPGSTANLCVACHGGANTVDILRSIWQDYGIAPTLSWTGATGYEGDGANPDAGSAVTQIVFKVSYADGNNDAPVYVNVLVDLNDDGDFGDVGEVLPMNAEIPGDHTYYNGNTYSIAVVPAKAGDGSLDYGFETSDGVTGVSATPTRTITVENVEPELVFTGETGYSSDGVAPNGGTSDITDFEFRIAYRDGDGESPVGGAPSLLIDKNDDGDFGDSGESVIMIDLGDPSVISGKRFAYTTTLSRPSDDTLNYCFEGSDGTSSVRSAVGTLSVVPDVNLAPSLDWTGEPEYTSDGASPDRQAATKPFTFRVSYSDRNNDAPGVGQVWIDLDDDGLYQPGEKLDMTRTVTAEDPDAVDGDFTNGEILQANVSIPMPTAPSDGTISYCFHFEDNEAMAATGIQESDRYLTVYEALYVPSEYLTIQDAVMAADTSDTVLVDDGTYSGFAFNRRDITVESVNGPEVTIIEEPGGTGVNFNYYLSNPSDSTLAGFTIRGCDYGVFSNLSAVTLQDCILDGNTIGVYSQNGNGRTITIDGCTIRNSTDVAIRAANNTIDLRVYGTVFENNSNTTNGSCFRDAGGTSTFDGCTFDGNTTSGQGGALYFTSQSDVYLRDCVFTENAAGTEGGAIYFWGNVTGTNAWIDRCLFAGNRAASGGAVYTKQGDYEFTNCTFSGNLATGQAGGVRTYHDGHPTFLNCTFSGNRAAYGGGIYTATRLGLLSIRNCVLWSNESSMTVNDQIDGTDLANAEVQYTDIAQAFDSFDNQIGIIRTDPFFVDPIPASNAPTSSGDYHLSFESPCAGAGTSISAPADDIDGDGRPQGSGIDMGSDEILGGGAGGAMKFGPVGGSLAVPTDPTTHTAPPTIPALPVTANLVDENGFLLVSSNDPAMQGDAGRTISGASRDTGRDVGLVEAASPLGMPEPALPAAALGLTSLIALAWKALGRVF